MILAQIISVQIVRLVIHYLFENDSWPSCEVHMKIKMKIKRSSQNLSSILKNYWWRLIFSENIENLNSISSGTDLPLIWSIFQMSFDHVTVVRVLDNDKLCFRRFWCKSALEKKLFLYLRILMIFCKWNSFYWWEKKNRHDDDMEFDQVVLEYVDTWRRPIVIRKDSARQEWRYHEGIDVCTLNIFTKSKI